MSCSAIQTRPNDDDGALGHEFRKAMRRFTSTVSIIATADGELGVGMVATAVTSLSASPPAILVCVSHAASLHCPLLRRGVFTLNMLRSAQSELVAIFSGKVKGPERFMYGSWAYEDGLPWLIDAQATLFCRIDGHMTYSDHDIVVGRVEQVQVAEQISPLLWQDGRATSVRPNVHSDPAAE